LNLTNQKEYLEINADVVANSTNATTPPANDPTSPYYIDSLDTDWQDIMLSPAVMQNYSLSISGGNNTSTYYVSGGYVDQDGILLGTGYKKYSAKVNTNATKGKFRFDQNLTLLKYNKDDETIGSAGRGAVIEMLKMTPNIAPVDHSQVGGYGAVETDIVGHAAKNPYGAAYLFDNHESGYRISGNVSGSVELFKGLKYSLRAGTDVSNTKYVSHKPTYYMGPEDNNLSSATLKESLGENTFYILENLLNFDRTFGKHSINAVLGYTYQNNKYQAYTMSTSGLPNNDITQIGAGNPDAVTVSSYQTRSSMISYLGRAIYSYDSRYLFTMTVRRDGSSRFSPKSKWGNFPSLSAGWNIHKESFFPTQDVVKTMKLRASWGKLGNQEIGDYQYTGYINSNTSYVFGTDQNLVHGATQVAYPAQELKWEETASTNLGIDLGLLKNKLTASVDYYRNHTTDMLVSVPIPISSGSLPARILQNYGEMRSSGFEFSLEYRKSEGEFNYSINANISTEKNEVIKLGSKNPLWSGEYENGEGSTTKTMAGGSVGDFYLYHVEGIFQSDAEIVAYNKYYTDNNLPIPQPAAAPGDIRFLDNDKNGILNNNDKIYAGSPIPDLTAGVNFTANYKGFDFSMFWYGTYGNEIVNGMRYWTESMNTNLNYSARCLDRWTITNPSTTMPRAVQGDPNGNTRPSDRWLEDGSYLRLKNIEIGYQLNEKTLAKIHVKSLRVYASAQNLFTLTKYLGYDPELGGNSDTAGYNSTTADGVSAFSVRGVDRNIYPTAKTILLGVQLSF
jgi:TonB-linked SusC/RagA family outer membrane protein